MAPQPIRNVIVAGAGGTIGAPIVEALVASGKFKISALSRAESKATFPENVNVKKADYSSHAALVEALTGQDALICTLNDEAAGVQVQLIDAAIEAGVRRFIPSEFGGNEMEAIVPELEGGLAGKRAIIDILKQKATEAAGLGREFHWTGVNNGVLFDWSLQAAFLNISLPPTRSATIWDSGSNVFSATNTAAVASAIISILSTAEVETRERFVWIESFKTSQNEIVQVLEKVTGEKWAIENTTTEEQIVVSREALANGDFLGAYYRWIVAALLSGNEYIQFGDEQLDNRLLGLQQESIVTTVEELLSSAQR